MRGMIVKKKHYSCTLLCTSVCIGIPYESTCFASPLYLPIIHTALSISLSSLAHPVFLTPAFLLCNLQKKSKNKIFPPNNKFATNTRDRGGSASTNTLLLVVGRSHLYTPLGDSFLYSAVLLRCLPSTTLGFRTLHTPPQRILFTLLLCPARTVPSMTG